MPPYRPSGDRFKQEITDKMNSEEIAGSVYRAEDDTNAVVMFTQPKRDRHKEPRFLLDCRPRHAVTITNHTPLPNIEEAIEFVAARPWWSKIDLTDGYHNIRIDPDSEKHTTFLCHIGHYRCRVMQQGDCNAPATLVRAMYEIFGDIIFQDLIIYIDDIIISSATYKAHVEALRRALQRLQDQQFWLQGSKCQFFTKRLEILGHILTPEGLSADPQKVRKIFDFPEPPDKKQLQAFNAIVNYSSKFLPHQATVAASLTDLQGSTGTWKWTDPHQELFNQCKDLINNGQVINPWNSNSEEPKYQICDASDIALGSWLGQGTLDRIQAARFHSLKFNPAQLNYHRLQKELLAILDSLKFFEAQLRGTKFTILTDHKPLETFMDRTQPTQKLRRWQDFLASFDQTIVHTAGKVNYIADALSRNYKRPGTSTAEEDYISQSIDNTTPHRAPTLPTPPNTITCNHFSIPPLTTDMSEY